MPAVYYERALTLYRQLKQYKVTRLQYSAASAMSMTPWVTSVKALDFYEQALPLRRQPGILSGEATTLNNIGYGLRSPGGQAPGPYEFIQAGAIRCVSQVGDHDGEANTLYSIGVISDALGNKHQALYGVFKQALKLSRQIGDQVGKAKSIDQHRRRALPPGRSKSQTLMSTTSRRCLFGPRWATGAVPATALQQPWRGL